MYVSVAHFCTPILHYTTAVYKNEKAVEFSRTGDILSIKIKCRKEFLKYLGSVMKWEYH